MDGMIEVRRKLSSRRLSWASEVNLIFLRLLFCSVLQLLFSLATRDRILKDWICQHHLRY